MFGLTTLDQVPASPEDRVCLRRSQLVGGLRDLVPRELASCRLAFLGTSDLRFIVEPKAGDLVAAEDVCLSETMWKVSILVRYHCPQDISR